MKGINAIYFLGVLCLALMCTWMAWNYSRTSVITDECQRLEEPELSQCMDKAKKNAKVGDNVGKGLMGEKSSAP